MPRVPDLYGITDRSLVPGGDVVAAARAAFAAGLGWLQVREKDLDTRPLLALARAMLEAAREFDAKVLVNDRVDVAIAAGAHGVHMSELGIAVADVRRTFPDLIIGASVHGVEGAIAASRAGADFVQFGPVFATPAKAGYGPPQGLSSLHEVCESIPTPVIAVGGIGPGEVASCLAAGARGVAVIRGIFAMEDAGRAVEEYRARMGK